MKRKTKVLTAVIAMAVVLGLTGVSLQTLGQAEQAGTITQTVDQSTTAARPEEKPASPASETNRDADPAPEETQETKKEEETTQTPAAAPAETQADPTAASPQAPTAAADPQAPAAEVDQQAADAAPAQQTAAVTATQAAPVTETTTKSQGEDAVQVAGATETVSTPDNQTTQNPTTPAGESDGQTVTAADLIACTNAARQANGKEPLRTETSLTEAASLRAQEIAEKFSHTRPDGSSCFTVVSGDYQSMGENIAYIQGAASAQSFVDHWMASTGHRENILGDYDALAVGIYEDAASGYTYAVQIFVEDLDTVTYTYTDTVVEPTCTEQGYTLHTCNEDATKSYQDNYTDALGHDYQEGVCSRCGASDPDYQPEPEYTYTDTVVVPTCTEQGYTLHTCNEDAAKTYQDNYTDALGHDYQEGVCTRCGASDPDYQPEPEYTYTDTVVEPTCTEQGYTLHTCNEDATKSYQDNYTDALGHDWTGDDRDATCTRCRTSRYVLSYTVAPTCTETGYSVYTSVDDPSVTRKWDFTDPIDHVYENGYCTMCGAKEPSIPSYDSNYDQGYYNSAIQSLTNQERQKRGLQPYRYASEYQAAADTRAQELIVSFSHTRPDGSGPETALDALGAQYSHVGENIAYVSSMYKPGKIVDNWIASPTHCSNMMSETFDAFVVGTACSNGRVYAVQIFFTDASADENPIQTLTLDAAEAEVPAEAAPAPEVTPEVTEETPAAPEEIQEPEEAPAPTETPAEETPAPETEAAPTPEVSLPEQTPAPEILPETAPAPEAEAAPAPEAEAAPAPEETVAAETPAPTETPAEPAAEETPAETTQPEATPAPTEAPAETAAPEEAEPSAQEAEAALTAQEEPADANPQA